MSKGNLERFDFLDEMMGWIITTDNAVWATTDGGANWTEQLRDDAIIFEDIDFVDNQHGIVSTITRFLYRTNDGGNTWDKISLDNINRLADIEFVDAFHGWAANGQREIVRTEDGGNTWVLQPIPVLDGDPFIPSFGNKTLHFFNRYEGYVMTFRGVLGTSTGGE